MNAESDSSALGLGLESQMEPPRGSSLPHVPRGAPPRTPGQEHTPEAAVTPTQGLVDGDRTCGWEVIS